MATTKKNSQKAKQKGSLVEKIKALVPRKKASPGRAIKNALKTKTSRRLSPAVAEDPAHSPGHRRLQVKGSKGGKKIQGDETSALADDQRIQRNATNKRRVITGAAIGKHGRMA